MTITSVFSFAGGIGLFLLGMRLMTDGLKMAAGNALRDILAHWTATPLRGILVGTLITAAVQSSSAVIFATLGFVNAGLLSLTQALGVILGSSIGSTATSWLVAVIGVKLDLLLLALPAVALGTLLRITGRNGRRAALGDAITGFGIFFIGINVLKSSFDATSLHLPVEQFASADLVNLLIFVLIGIVLTVLMQSSGASLALTLTAVAGGVIPVSYGAAIVIGANVGTTSTSVIAMLGATADTKRAALGYVLFKVVLALLSLALLTPLLWLVGKISQLTGLGDSPAVLLAVFHTLINVIGVILMRPLIEPLAAFLQGRFRSQEDDESRPRHLDRNVADTPEMALEALKLELGRIGALSRRVASSVLDGSPAGRQAAAKDGQSVKALLRATDEFVTSVQRRELTEEIVTALPLALRIGRHYRSIIENATVLTQLRGQLEPITDGGIRAELQGFREQATLLLTEPAIIERLAAGEGAQIQAAWEEDYNSLKAMLLRAGSVGKLPISQMVSRLDEASAIRRMVRQSIRAAIHAHQLGKAIADVTPEDIDAAIAEPADNEPPAELAALPGGDSR